MNFSKENNNSIIDEIYESKREDYETFIDGTTKNERNISIISELLDKIENCAGNDVPDIDKNKIKTDCEKLDQAIVEELEFWQKKFYKLGFIDGMRMSEDIKTITKQENTEE